MARGFRGIRDDPLAFLERTQRQYGDLVAFPVPGPPVLLVSDPAQVRRVLQTRSRTWTKATVQYAALATVTGPGLLAVADDGWLPRRRVAQPSFHHGRLDSIGDAVARAADAVVASWADLPSAGALVDIDALAMRVTLDVVGRTMFDQDLRDETARLVHATEEAAELVVAQGRSLPLPSWAPTRTRRRLHRAVRSLDDICYRLIAERRRRGVASDDADLLGLLVAAGLPDAAVRDELVTVVVAGHETVASALGWTLMLLAEHPDVQHRVREECRVPVPSLTGLKDARAWTRAVVDESLRVFPPGWVVSRRTTRPDALGGQPVPAGTLAIISPWLLHRRPDAWPDPEQFRPERFLGAGAAANRPDYIPFGLGPRLCIGRDFALVELTVLLGVLLRDHEVELPQGWARPALNAFVTLRPRGGLSLMVRRCRPPQPPSPGR